MSSYYKFIKSLIDNLRIIFEKSLRMNPYKYTYIYIFQNQGQHNRGGGVGGGGSRGGYNSNNLPGRGGGNMRYHGSDDRFYPPPRDHQRR